MKKLIRIVIYVLAFMPPIVRLGTFGYFSNMSLTLPKPTDLDIPQVEQYSAGTDLTMVGLINLLFHWNHPTAGVLLYDGINELELASTYDTYGATSTDHERWLNCPHSSLNWHLLGS